MAKCHSGVQKQGSTGASKTGVVSRDSHGVGELSCQIKFPDLSPILEINAQLLFPIILIYLAFVEAHTT